MIELIVSIVIFMVSVRMSLISGISVFCFAASYTVALVLEITRLFFRSGVRGAVMLGFGGAGLLAHTLFLAHRATTAETTPLSSSFDWYLLAAWVLVVIYLYLTRYHPKTAIGIFLLPLVLGLIGLAQLSDDRPFPQSDAGRVWGLIHGIFHLLGLVAVTVGFVAGVMYLIQSYRLKHKLPPTSGLRLPSLEWLERVNARAIVISVLMVGAGFLSGVVLNLVLHRRNTDEVPWSDPIIWRSALMFAWLLAAAIFSALYRPARSGRKVAYLTVASFVFLAASVGVGLVVPSEHGGGVKAEGGRRKAEAGGDCRLQIADCRLQNDDGSELHGRSRALDRSLHKHWYIPPKGQPTFEQSKIRNLQSKICNLKTAIYNHPSPFRLPPSALHLPPSLELPA